MGFNPEELGFWAKVLLVVIFGLWGLSIAGKTMDYDLKTGKGGPGQLHLVAFLISFILVVAALVMYVVGYRWPAGFDYVLVAAISLFVPAILGLIIKAQEEKVR